jgi:hypothetical protein
VKQLYQQAVAAGAGAAFLAALKAVFARLRDDPEHFGEPLYHLDQMELAIRVAVVPPLVVEYAVYDKSPLVFIKRVDTL